MKDLRVVFLLWLGAIVFRVLHYLVFSNKLVALSDPMQNILLARRFAAGNFYGVLDTYWTPLYGILVGTVTYFIDDLILPAVIVSLVAGSLVAPLTYYLIKQSYTQREAVIASIIAIFHPSLINSFFSIGTEPIYLVWAISALIVGWKALQRNSTTDFFLTGILLGLAYLTRPEAIGYPIFFVSLILGRDLLQRKLFTRSSLLQIGTLLLGFSLLSAPYIFYLRSETGTWTISGKAMTNIVSGALQETNEEETKKPKLDKLSWKELTIEIGLGFRESGKILSNLLPFLLMIFIGLGLFGEFWEKERLKRETYLFFFCLLTICGYSVSVALERYFFVLLPIFFGWMARGIIQLEHWSHKSVQNWLPNKFIYLLNSRNFVILCLIFIFVYLFPTYFFVRSTESAWQSAAFEERDAGKWLKENGKTSPIIFSASFRPVFYAKGEQFWTETKDFDGIINQIKQRKVDYVVDNDRSYRKHPHLKGLTEVLQNNPDFELIYQKNEQPGYKISIFKIRQN